ncbi:MAG: trypsin-like peptidase domain-containing protein [Acidobacteriota bacterium]
MPLRVTIHHLTGSLTGRSQQIELGPNARIRLGRDPGSDVKFHDNADDSVSGVHAALLCDGDRLFVEDQRSANGTFVNGAPCAAFQRIAVPDGARVRLAHDGPEMQITTDVVPTATALIPMPASTPDADPAADRGSAAAARVSLRERLLAQASARGRPAGLAAVLMLVLGGIGFAYHEDASSRTAVTDRPISAPPPVAPPSRGWPEAERAVRRAVAFVRCAYHLERPVSIASSSAVPVRLESTEVSGSAVLIGDGLVLTAKHVVEPWKYALDWSQSPFADWDAFARRTGMTPVYESLTIQFPGFQPIAGQVVATSETSDLALVSIPTLSVPPVAVAHTNDAIQVTDEVGILGYPRGIGRVGLIQFDRSGAGRTQVEIGNMEPTFFKGTVSRFTDASNGDAPLFSIDASIEPGNSGGPVINRDGTVIGVVVAHLEESTDVRTINGVEIASREVVESAGRAVSPADVDAFLRRAGIR